MQKQYIEARGYRSNLFTLLKRQEKQRKIEILTEQPAVFGKNPFLPTSIIAWRPRQAL
jgi:hypothetical protein